MGKYHRPCSLKEALDVLATQHVTVAAGCTDLFPATEKQRVQGNVLDITAIEELRGIVETEVGWRIGASTTWTDLLETNLPCGFNMLKEAAREVGSIQIQNVGTVVGNLCNASPAADGIPPLLALNAEIELASSGGNRSLPLAEFLKGVRETDLSHDEMVIAIHVPKKSGDGVSSFLKLGARKHLVISIVMTAVRVVVREGIIREAAIAIGSCSPVAQRLTAVETKILGIPIDEAPNTLNSDDILVSISPISDIRGSADYRLNAALELLRRALRDIAENVR
ncbi:FAD binding domain-containing protein [Pseudopelagicola sp. nBUS_20]|uniref:FAD binding domain-containing protein n=1 Tax=Pseudopelagicola sp. nBUS_20 TaxID=3395317 RepID=UPI003EBD292D